MFHRRVNPQFWCEQQEQGVKGSEEDSMSSGDQTHPTNPNPPQVQDSHSPDYAPYPKLDPNDVAPPHLQQPINTADTPTSPPDSRAPISGDAATTLPQESNPYVTPAPVSAPTTAKSLFFL